MRKRDFLLGAGATFAASGLSACAHSASAGAAPAAGVPRAYARAHELIASQVAQGKFPGAVWLVAHGDQVVVDTVGSRTLDGSAPMRRDTIFRIASMTKALTAASVMVLVEENKIRLDESAERLLPELANRRVLRSFTSALDDTVPAERPITVHDIMNFTFGFGMISETNSPIAQAVRESQLMGMGGGPYALDEWMRRFGALPLMAQPGQRFLYNVGSVLQAALVQRASGQPFHEFLRARIIEPLGMVDTGFVLPREKLSRFADVGLTEDYVTGRTVVFDQNGEQSGYLALRPFPSGAGGLFSTVDDYLAFERMLRAGGMHNGQRVLQESSVRAMTSSQLTDAQRAASMQSASVEPGFFANHSWGYGMAVQTGPVPYQPVAGAYGWDGAMGTSVLNDPNRDLIIILLTQSTNMFYILEDFRARVYAATA